MTSDAPPPRPPYTQPAAIYALPTRARTALCVGLLAVLYLWVFPYHPRVNNPNENVRVYMTVAMVDDHTFAINRLERDWGYVNDKAARDTPLAEVARRRIGAETLRYLVPDDALARMRAGHPRPHDAQYHPRLLYSSKAPGTSYLGVPAYWLLTKLTGRDSRALTPAQMAAHHAPPLDRTTIVYVLRLWANVLPALVFAWFWHRFLGRYTRFPALRDAVFFSTMAGSLLFAYSEMFASHAHNAFAVMAALMALATVRRRDRAYTPWPSWSLGLMAVAGLFGAAATMFEYPAALGTAGVALLILATGAERRREAALTAVAFGFVALLLALRKHTLAAAICMLPAVLAFATTLTRRSLARFVAAGVGAAVPTGLTLLFHARAFGGPFTPGYKFLENPEFRATTSVGFFGATSFSWDAALHLWFDPAYGVVPSTVILLACVAGFGAMLAWRPPRPAVAPVRAALALFVAVAAYKSVVLVLSAKAANWQGHAVADMAWVAYLVIALVLLASVTLPRATNADPGLAAAALLSCYGLMRLIGMMNNWRGGWVVGPRYLATLIPILGLAALSGLDAFAQRSTARQRIATVFAAGATVHALVVSGLPSALFPHIPTEYVSPVFELFLPLLRDDYVPYNAGRYLFHWQGLKGLVPALVAAGAVALLLIRGQERRPVAIAAHAAGALAVTLALLAPIAAAAKYETTSVTRFVRSTWDPPRPDVPAGVSAPRSSSPAVLRTTGRRLAESGDAAGALEAFRRAAVAAP